MKDIKFSEIAYLENSDFDNDGNLTNPILKDKKNVSVKNFNGYWLDIGRPDDYMQAIEEFGEMKSRFINE